MGDFTTAGEVESVTAHEVINISAAADIVFGIVSGKAMGSISGAAQIGRFTCGSSELKKAKAAYQIASNVVHAATDQLISTGKLDPYGLAVGVGTGLVQGYLGSSITNGLLSCLGMQDIKLLEALIGTGADVGLDALMSALAGTDFDFWDSMAQNGFANFLAAYISDPVDAVTGAYLIRSTDFILASLPSALNWKGLTVPRRRRIRYSAGAGASLMQAVFSVTRRMRKIPAFI